MSISFGFNLLFVVSLSVSLVMRYMIFVDCCGGFVLTLGCLSTALLFLHCFAVDSCIIMDNESINYSHLLHSINDVLTIFA